MYPFNDRLSLSKNQELILFPFGDVQSEEILDELDYVVKELLGFKKAGCGLWGFGLGDYFETFSPSERARKAGANFHETTVADISKSVREKAEYFAERVKPLKGYIRVILQGHHWDMIKTKDGRLMYSDAYIAEKLGAEYAGDGVALMNITINGLPFRVVGMHGYGSARTPGARLNKRVAMRDIDPSANWYCMGHDNSMVSDPRQVLIRQPDGSYSYMRQYFSGIGCIQEAYGNGIEAGYAEKLALPPACIGFLHMRVAVREMNGKDRLWYRMTV